MGLFQTLIQIGAGRNARSLFRAYLVSVMGLDGLFAGFAKVRVKTANPPHKRAKRAAQSASVVLAAAISAHVARLTTRATTS